MNNNENSSKLNNIIGMLKDNDYKVYDSYDSKKSNEEEIEENEENKESYITLLRNKNATKLMTKMYKMGNHIKLETLDKKVPILEESKPENGIKYSTFFKSDDASLEKVEKEISKGISNNFSDIDYLRELRTMRCIESSLLNSESDHTSLSFEVDLRAKVREGISGSDNRLIIKTKQNTKRNGYVDLKDFTLPLSAFLDFDEAKNEDELNTLKNTFGTFDNGRTLVVYLQESNIEMIPGVISIVNELEKTSKFILLPEESEFYEESNADNLDDVSNVEITPCDNSLSNDTLEEETETSNEIENDEN